MTFKFFATAFATVLSLTAFAGSGKADINIPNVPLIDPDILDQITTPQIDPNIAENLRRGGYGLYERTYEVVLTAGQGYDLDAGRITNDSTAEFYFEFSRHNRPYMTAYRENGGLMAASIGRDMSYTECSTQRFTPRRTYLLREVGKYICVQTNEGNYATVKIDYVQIATGATPTLYLTYKTWR